MGLSIPLLQLVVGFHKLASMQTWAQKIVRRLCRRKWTLDAIARETGMSLSSVADLKQGRVREPRGRERARRLEALGEKVFPCKRS